MRGYLKIGLLACLLPGPPVVAAIDCDVVAGIERLHAAEARLLAAGPWQYNASDLRIVQQEAGRLDPSNISYALRDHPTASDVDIATAFWLRASMLSVVARQNDTVSLRFFLEHRDTIKMHTRMKRIIPRFNCSPQPEATPSQTTGQDRNGTGIRLTDAPRTALGFSLSPVTLMLFGLVAGLLVAASWFIWAPKLLARTTRKRRRRKRFTTQIPTQLQVADEVAASVVVDISCMGAKIRHGGQLTPKQGQAVKLRLDGQWRRATVSWTNQWYCGIVFAEPIRLAALALILNSSRRTSKQTKTAPEARTPP